MLFVFAEFGVEGKGEDLGGGALGLGEVSGTVAEEGKRGLEVEGERIVDFGSDARCGKSGAELVAAGSADDVLMEDVLRARVGVGEDQAVGDSGGVFRGGHGGDARGQEELMVSRGEVATSLIPPGDVLQFDPEDGGLDGVEA